jgi:hypothetical protein
MSDGARVLAVFAALAVAGPLPARAGVTTLLVVAGKPAGTEYGNAFLVRRPGGGGHLLVTALHVVYGSVSIQAYTVNCRAAKGERVNELAWSTGKKTEAWLWPQYDLAAFPLDEAAVAKIEVAVATLREVPPPAAGELVFQPPERTLEERARFDLHATSKDSPCQAGHATLHAIATAHGYQGSEFGPAKVTLGSMDEDAPLVVYESSIAAGGASGAAVVEPGPTARVVGVHIGGFEHRDTACAIWTEKLGESLWAKPDATAIVGKPGWPTTYRAPGIGQSARAVPEAVRASTVPHVPGDWFLAASTTVEHGIGSHAYQGPITGVRATLTGAPYALHGGAWLVSGGVRRGRYREEFRAPDGTVLGVRNDAEGGGTLAMGGEYRLAQLRKLRAAAGASVRLWTFELDPAGWVPSFPVHVRGTWTIIDRLAATLEGFLAPEWGHDPDRVYTGIGAEADDRPRAWGVTWGVAFGLEY